MNTYADKAQTPAKASGICRACGGTGTLTKQVDGKELSMKCVHCRGTGEAGKGYQTK